MSKIGEIINWNSEFDLEVVAGDSCEDCYFKNHFSFVCFKECVLSHKENKKHIYFKQVKKKSNNVTKDPTDPIDNVNKPVHYKGPQVEIQCIEIKRYLPASLGDAFKYLWRAGKKLNEKEDLQKAIFYIRDYAKYPVLISKDSYTVITTVFGLIKTKLNNNKILLDIILLADPNLSSGSKIAGCANVVDKIERLISELK